MAEGPAADADAGRSHDRSRWVRAQPAVLAFVLLTVSGVLWQTAAQHVVSPRLDVVDRYGVRLVDVAAGEWWRLLSAAFISSEGWPHALLNVAGVMLVAGPLERERGTRKVVILFVVSAAAAFAAGVWWHGAHWLSAGGSGLVLGCAGFIAARWATVSRQARVGAALVIAVTFALPAALSLAGIEPRGSVPAHLGGFAAGAVVGLVPARRLLPTAAAVMTLAVASILPLLMPLFPEEAEVVGCNTDSSSASARGPETRILFVSDRSDVAVRWISPTGEPGDKHFFTGDRRGQMPWYTYEGALYEIVDADDRCLVRARATRSTSTVNIAD